MQYSYNWLKELSQTEKTAEELAQMVTLKGFELEEVVNLGGKFDNFVVGKILAINQHPNADKLQLVSVDVEAENQQPLEVVCGAWNIKVGDIVPVALVGAIVPQNKIKVEAREVRGVKSFGMLCAEDELGLGKDHSGIMLLDPETKIGQPLAEALYLNDKVLDFSILPNRAHDCLCHTGMASEICVMEGRQIKGKRESAFACWLRRDKSAFAKATADKQVKGSEVGKRLNIAIKDEKLCPRYIGAVLTNIQIGQSPKWMQARLIASGMEPINNVVDITNYVMLELENPLHAFDLAKVKGQNDQVKIVVRKATNKEQLELLDESQLVLDENDLVIANEERVLALAGIKGGKDSGISAETTEIVLEAANFNAYNIRKTRQRHALQTESQARFEKSISPTLAAMAAARAIELLQEHAGAKLEELVDVNHANQEKEIVKLELDYVSRLLGYKVADKEVINILENFGFVIKNPTDKVLEIEVPAWRLDVEGSEDLIEEVGRIIGYENINEQPIQKDIALPQPNKEREFEWQTKDLLASQGFDEVINYSFYSDEDAQIFGNPENNLELENPLTQDSRLMRKTLLPGILRNVILNEKYYDEFAIFELGRVYNLDDNRVIEDLKLSGAWYNGSKKPENNFYSLKGKITAILEKLTKRKVRFMSLENQSSQAFNLARTAVVVIGEQVLGVLGEISQLAQKNYGFKKRVTVFELDFRSIQQLAGKITKYQPARIYPEVKRDISLFVDYKTQVDEVQALIEDAAGKLLLEQDLFDVYLDKENNRKSLAFHLAFGADERTLESSEVDKIFEKIVKVLETKVKAEVRK